VLAEGQSVAPASDLRERAYQVFGAEFLDDIQQLSESEGLTNKNL